MGRGVRKAHQNKQAMCQLAKEKKTWSLEQVLYQSRAKGGPNRFRNGA